MYSPFFETSLVSSPHLFFLLRFLGRYFNHQNPRLANGRTPMHLSTPSLYWFIRLALLTVFIWAGNQPDDAYHAL